MLDHISNGVGELFGLERQPADSRERDRVNKEPRTDDQRQLAEVHLRYADPVVPPDDVARIGGQRVEVAQLCVRDLSAVASYELHRGPDLTVRRPPPEHE